ncbi:MAG: hypothetical protein KF688_14540 [Pirellulales bacterium]|nr:hypothetical protein [Pirellulales bacterium]
MIRYLNTDLELISADDLTAHAVAFEGGGLRPLHAAQGADGRGERVPAGHSLSPPRARAAELALCQFESVGLVTTQPVAKARVRSSHPKGKE